MMRQLPSGTVTFLFSDIEGSTALLHELGAERYAESLAEHRRVLRRAFAAHGGVEVDTQGDAFFVAFAEAREGLAAAREAQQALAQARIRVRMGLHTGEPLLTGDGYVGADVHKAARIGSTGHGGQIVLSEQTRLEIEDGDVRPLGLHRLKDLTAPEPLYQVGEADFPPLKSLSQSNLPEQPTPFVGRERELAEVLQLLRRDGRLLTLTGPGGSGKTRLAVQAAAEVVEAREHGVWWVDLQALRDPELVLPAIASTIGASVDLAEHIGNRRMLLLVDNLEQVVGAAPELGGLLRSCPNLTLLVTSREPLLLAAEQEYPVPPFVEQEAVGFFLTRARAVRPGFSEEEAIPEICARLDHLPLALELAAARVKALSPAQILERMERRLPLLTGGPRDAPERQRTLRATIEWSYDLLSPQEQELFRRLAVSSGGCTLAAAEEICGADLDALQSLIDKSLLRFDEERYTMLETIREYALERLRESGQHADLRRRHAHYYLLLAERLEEGSAGSQAGWLALLDKERGNFRLALEWLDEDGAREEELRLAIAVARFWRIRGPIEEGRSCLERALARSEGADPALRAEALGWAATLARRQGEYSAAQDYAYEALAIERAAGNQKGFAQALTDLGCACGEAGDSPRARALFEQSIQVSRRIEEPAVLARALANSGLLQADGGNLVDASEQLEESVAISRRLGDQSLMVFALVGLGSTARRQGQLEDAAHLLEEALMLSADLRASEEAAICLEEMAVVLRWRDDRRSAATLLSAAEGLQQEVGITFSPFEAQQRARRLADVRGSLDDAEFHAAWTRGASLTFDQAVGLGLSVCAEVLASRT